MALSPLLRSFITLERPGLAHAVLVRLDHLFDHLAADGACLTGSQIAVISLLESNADFC